MKTEFLKAIDIFGVHLNASEHRFYRAVSFDSSSSVDDVLDLTVLIVRINADESHTLVGQLTRDMKRPNAKERRALERTFSGSRSSRKRAAKVKRFLRLSVFDSSLDVLIDPLVAAGVIRNPGPAAVTTTTDDAGACDASHPSGDSSAS